LRSAAGRDGTGSDLAERLAAAGYAVATLVNPRAIRTLQVNEAQQAIEHVARSYTVPYRVFVQAALLRAYMDRELDVVPAAFNLYAFRDQQQKKMEDVLAIRRAVAEMFPQSARASVQLAGALEAGQRLRVSRGRGSANRNSDAIIAPEDGDGFKIETETSSGVASRASNPSSYLLIPPLPGAHAGADCSRVDHRPRA
jgi:hypothetical protein